MTISPIALAIIPISAVGLMAGEPLTSRMAKPVTRNSSTFVEPAVDPADFHRMSLRGNPAVGSSNLDPAFYRPTEECLPNAGYALPYRPSVTTSQPLGAVR
jgi:hypothetical protein